MTAEEVFKSSGFRSSKDGTFRKRCSGGYLVFHRLDDTTWNFKHDVGGAGKVTVSSYSDENFAKYIKDVQEAVAARVPPEPKRKSAKKARKKGPKANRKTPYTHFVKACSAVGFRTEKGLVDIKAIASAWREYKKDGSLPEGFPADWNPVDAEGTGMDPVDDDNVIEFEPEISPPPPEPVDVAVQEPSPSQKPLDMTFDGIVEKIMSLTFEPERTAPDTEEMVMPAYGDEITFGAPKSDDCGCEEMVFEGVDEEEIVEELAENIIFESPVEPEGEDIIEFEASGGRGVREYDSPGGAVDTGENPAVSLLPEKGAKPLSSAGNKIYEARGIASDLPEIPKEARKAAKRAAKKVLGKKKGKDIFTIPRFFGPTRKGAREYGDIPEQEKENPKLGRAVEMRSRHSKEPWEQRNAPGDKLSPNVTLGAGIALMLAGPLLAFMQNRKQNQVE